MFASVHRRGVTEVHASDLTPDKFQDAATQTAAPALPRPSAEVRTVLLTGATGFLGRYLTLEWLERLSLVDGKVVRRPQEITEWSPAPLLCAWQCRWAPIGSDTCGS